MRYIKAEAQVTSQGPCLLIQHFLLRPWKPHRILQGPFPARCHQSSSMTQKTSQICPSSPGTATLAQTVTSLAPAGPPASCSCHQHPPQRGKRIILNHKSHTWVLFTVPQSHRGQVQKPQRAPQGTKNVVPATQPPLNDKVKKDPR